MAVVAPASAATTPVGTPTGVNTDPRTRTVVVGAGELRVAAGVASSDLSSMRSSPLFLPSRARPTSTNVLQANSATFVDPFGDGESGLAPDITIVVVSNNDAGVLTFQITIATTTSGSLIPGEFVAAFLDTDQNPATGATALGAEYSVGILGQFGDDLIGLSRWNGSGWTAIPSTLTGYWSGTTAVFSFNRADIGAPAGFNLIVGSIYQGIYDDYVDFAPNSGYWNYQIRLAAPPPPPPPLPPPPPPVPPPAPPPPAPPAPPPSPPKTYRSAPGLPSRSTFNDSRSIKHSRLSDSIYSVTKVVGVPRQLAVACWSSDDWDNVLSSTEGLALYNRFDSVTLGFWLSRQPRWLHMSPVVCRDVQRLLSIRTINGRRAAMLSGVVHEMTHALGIRTEALANCYAVQLVAWYAKELGFSTRAALRIQRAAVNYVRAHAPRNYWNASRCRDGGAWDLIDDVPNLSG